METINAFASRLLRVTTVSQSAWAVAKHAVGRLGYIDCVVYLINEDGELYQCAAHGNKNPIAFDIENPIKLKMGEGICGHVALSGIGEVIADTSKDSRYEVDDASRFSEITVPILSDGKVIGIIDSEHPDKNYFSDHDLEILNTIASMLSVKISQARAIEELANHKADLEERVEESTKELRETIVKLRESNEEIRRSNIEKGTMLREIHHRVKNNLQIVSSLLNMQANKMEGEISYADVFADCQNRIKAMSIIHDQLYNEENLSEINAKKYIEEIGNELIKAYKPHGNVTLDLNLEPLFLDIEKSVPFGLILNELIVNALKHAFDDRDGILTIALRRLQDSVEIVVSDTGNGFDIDKEWDTMGMDLIKTLTTQLEGSLKFNSSEKGTNCTVIFPL